MKKLKIKKSALIIMIVVFIILIILIIKPFSKSNKIIELVDNSCVYKKPVVTANMGSNNNVIMVFENDYKEMDTCIVTTEVLDKLDSKKFNLELKEYLKNIDLTKKEEYNIKKALELKIVDENTKYVDYLSLSCGAKNKKELINNIEEVRNCKLIELENVK